MATITDWSIDTLDNDGYRELQAIPAVDDPGEWITRYPGTYGYHMEGSTLWQDSTYVYFTFGFSVTSGEASSASPAWGVLSIQSLENPALVQHYVMDSRTSAGTANFAIAVGVSASTTTPDKISVTPAPEWFVADSNLPYSVTFSVRRRVVGSGTSKPSFDELGEPLVSRATTIWTNRRPSPPTITSPPSGITVVYGSGVASDFDLTWQPGTDPDAVGTGTPKEEDIGGWELQMREAPTAENPDPAWNYWTPIASDSAWRLKDTDVGKALSVGPDCNTGYLGDRYDQFVVRVRADTDNTDPYPGAPLVRIYFPGAWQFRVRILDESAWHPRNYTRHQGSTFCQAFNDNPYGTPLFPYGGPSRVGDWSQPITVYVDAPFLPPLPIAPVNDAAVAVEPGSTINFEWQFRDPRDQETEQASRRLRVRRAGQGEESWVEIIEGTDQDSNEQTFAYLNDGTPYLFEAGFRYEWQAFTVSSPDDYESGWGPSGFFWGVPPPGSGPIFPLPGETYPDASLGCGVNRAFLFRKGGVVPLGEVTETTMITWGRLRDDISEARVTVSLASARPECQSLLANARSWLHEMVIFRDMGNGLERVWEGPVTRVTYRSDLVEIAARDVMIWPYRRILRQGYNDAYREGGGLTPVTIRSQRILQNALAYDDPNILAYLTMLNASDDARQSRIVPDYSRSSWQDVDDMAAKSGLDYTTVGRRIILWDTHNAIGLLPEMRDGDFDSDPIVTEYGMQAANYYASTNNNGVYGYAERTSMRDEYGMIEMLSSAWGEEDEAGSDITLTAAARAQLVAALTDQAERNISSRWPVPVVVRVPDNSTLSPDVGIGINQLIPGVHIPLRATNTLRKVAQLQKLDVLKVTQTSEEGEKVQVTLSPAPRSREDDPDTGGGDDE